MDPRAVSFIQASTTAPGVYQMFAQDGRLLYVGKAKNLKKRLLSYLKTETLSRKTAVLVQQIASIETTVTHSETEALILECQLIKANQPRYNILLRDDKSYPYIRLSDDIFPRLSLYRSRTPDQHCFGPYPSTQAARNTIGLIQQFFLLRTCTNRYFKARTRPCLLHQIKRCAAPCVGLIPVEDYRQAISEAILFLQGQSEAIITHWVRQMNQEAHALHYEQAALYRDRIKNLQKISEQQSVSHVEKIDADVVTAALQQGEYVSVVLLRFRSGRLMGSHFFEAKIPLDETLAQALLLFLSQYYLEQGSDQIPAEIVSDIGIDDAPLLLDFLYQKTQRRVSFQSQGSGVKGLRARWLSLAHQNLIEKTKPFEMRCDLLQEALKLGTEAFTVECFDISHTFGTHAVGACVVLNRQGFQKKLFRRYHLAQHRDDISALKEVLMRRYQKHPLPNVIVMDGGRTQVQMAGRVLSEYRSGLGYQTEASGLPCILGIVKGQRRKAQYDRILRWAPLTGDSTGQIQGQIQEWMFEPQDPIRHLIQQVRDEAHRFAITGHRTLRTKAQQHSIIQNIPGMGAKRRKVLLNHLGGWQEIESATLEQLIRVPGIGVKIAEKMIEFLKQNKKNKG